MAKLRSKSNKNGRGPEPLATATQEECIEYASRSRLAALKKMEALAAAEYLDSYGEALKDKYNLPTAFTLDLKSGDFTAPVESGAFSSVKGGTGG